MSQRLRFPRSKGLILAACWLPHAEDSGSSAATRVLSWDLCEVTSEVPTSAHGLLACTVELARASRDLIDYREASRCRARSFTVATRRPI